MGWVRVPLNNPKDFYNWGSGTECWDGEDSGFPVIHKGNCFAVPHGARPLMSPDVAGETDRLIAASSKWPLDGTSFKMHWYSPQDVRETFDCDRETMRRLQSGFFCIVRTRATNNRLTQHYYAKPWGKPMPLIDPAADRHAVASKMRIANHNLDVLEKRLSWSIAVRRTRDHIAIRLPTDPTGCLSLLRDRERNRTRRNPLLHWVSEHFRQNRSNDDVHIVREYLRGSRNCVWRGYSVEIRESELEREKLVNRDDHSTVRQ